MSNLNLIINNLFTDVELVLDDNKEPISIHAHQNILASKCDYFTKLFTFNSNTHQNKFILKVDNAKIVKDLIYSFYGKEIEYPDNRYLLEMFKCRDFFCLNNDVTKLYNLKIHPDDFDLFLEIVDKFEYNNDFRLIKTIKNNIPKDYDDDSLMGEINERLKMDLRIVSGSVDNTIKIWDAWSGQLINTLTGHNNSVWCVVFSLDNSKIVSGSSDRTIRIWDAYSGQLINTLIGHNNSVMSVAFSPDNSKIVSGGYDETIKIWDVFSGQLINTLTDHNFITSVTFSPDSSKIVSGGGDKNIKIWDALSGQLINTLTGHRGSVYSVVFSPDNSKIVSGSLDATIKVWDALSGKLINTLSGHHNSIYNVAFSPDSSKIISGSYDNTVKIWDALSLYPKDQTKLGSYVSSFTCQLINTLAGHNDFIWSVAFSSDSSKIVSGSQDKTVKIWNALSGQLINTLTGHHGSVLSVVFSN